MNKVLSIAGMAAVRETMKRNVGQPPQKPAKKEEENALKEKQK